MMEEITVKWRSPSNIALVKYWGKRANQIPENPSISFTLTEAYTDMQVKLSTGRPRGLDFRFENKPNEVFAQKIQLLLESLKEELPEVSKAYIEIISTNSFPHSTGIASSASAMSALMLCLTDVESMISGDHTIKKISNISRLSRLASGSASRSVYPYLALWGKAMDVRDSADEYAIAYEEVDERFYDYHDDVIIISSEIKAVSSSAGHKLMKGNPFAVARYEQANDNLRQLLEAMRQYDLERFCQIVEMEAMSLHALMMCSNPSYVLMKPNTLLAIERIRAYRRSTKLPISFTLDAGPNIHLLYPAEIADEVKHFIKDELMPLAENGYIIKDKVGAGPRKLL